MDKRCEEVESEDGLKELLQKYNDEETKENNKELLFTI